MIRAKRIRPILRPSDSAAINPSLADSTAPALTRLWPADEGLVDLHHPGQTLPARRTIARRNLCNQFQAVR